MIATKVTDGLRADWNAKKEKLKVRFPKLTDDDLNFEANKKEEMFARLEMKLALTKREIQGILDSQ